MRQFGACWRIRFDLNSVYTYFHIQTFEWIFHIDYFIICDDAEKRTKKNIPIFWSISLPNIRILNRLAKYQFGRCVELNSSKWLKIETINFHFNLNYLFKSMLCWMLSCHFTDDKKNVIVHLTIKSIGYIFFGQDKKYASFCSDIDSFWFFFMFTLWLFD